MPPLTEGLDELDAWRRGLGLSHEFYQRVEQVAEEAKTLVPPCLPTLKITYAPNDHAKEKRRAARRAVVEFERFNVALENSDMKTLNNVRTALEGIGADLLRLSWELEAVEDVDEQLIRKAGHLLHVANIRETEVIGFRPEQELHDQLAPVIDKLRELADASSTS